MNEEHKQFYQPEIFVDTRFKRTTQPIFALAVCEHFRHLRLDETALADYYAAGPDEQVQMLVKFVRRHYQDNDGKAAIWGNISHYVCKLEPSKVLIIYPDGRTEYSEVAPARSEARLMHKNKTIPLP